MSNARDKANIPALNFSSTGIDDNATSTAVTINSSQQVGIGTTSPAYRLESVITNSGSEASCLTVRNNATADNTSTSIYFVNSTDPTSSSNRNKITSKRTSSGNHHLEFHTNNGTLAERMRITSAGNVGIGTSSPDSILDLTSTPGNNIIHFNATTGGSNGDIIGGFEVNNTGGTIGKLTVNRESTSSSGYMAFQTGTSEKMRIQNNGNVGIGENAPEAKLHVKTSQSGLTPSVNADDLFVESSGSTGITIGSGTGNFGRINFGDSGDANIGIIQYEHTTNAFAFTTNASERMRITSAGSVGIGTSSPTQKLDVNGTVKATAFQGDGSALTGVGGANTPAFSAERSGPQSISATTRTTILFNNEFYDSSSAYNTSTGKFTPQTAGKYFITANVLLNGVTDSNYKWGFIELYKNATFVAESVQDERGTNAARQRTASISCILDMNGSSDFVLIQGWIDVHSGSPSINDTSTFSAFRIIE